MTDQQAFIDAIDNDPNNPALLLLYADWLAEHGQDDRGWRWLGDNRKHPHTLSDGSYTFFRENCEDRSGNIGYAANDVPVSNCKLFRCYELAAAGIVARWSIEGYLCGPESVP